MQSKTRLGLTRSLVLFLVLLAAVVVPGTPAHATWAAPLNTTIQVTYYTSSGVPQSLGRAEGYVQLDDGGNSLRYSFLFCRQSSYALPYMQVFVNVSYIGGRRYATLLTTIYPSYSGYSATQPCYAQQGTVANEHTYANFFNVEFQLFGSTFSGQNYVTAMEDQIFYNPY